MKESITLEDPRLTAYALGDLESSQDRALIEAAIKDSTELQVYVEDIRALGKTLTLGFDTELLPEPDKVVKPRAYVWRYVVPLGLAASLALLLTLRPEHLEKMSLASGRDVAAKKLEILDSLHDAMTAEDLLAKDANENESEGLGTVAALSEFADAKEAGVTQVSPRPPSETRGVSAPEAEVVDRVDALMDSSFGFGERDNLAKPETFDSRSRENLSATGDPVTGVGTILMSSLQDTYKTDAAIAQVRAQITALDGLEGERLLQSVSMLESSDPAFQSLFFTYQTLHREEAGLRASGLDQEHPSVREANEKLSQTRTLLDSATEVVRTGLETKLRKAEKALSLSKQIEAPRPNNTESYAPTVDNAFKDIVNPGDERATFSTDVDTASFSNVRRFLTNGQRPPRDAIRVEEMINYFHYDYPQPEGDHPFSVKLEVNDAPWTPGHRLLRIGLKAKDVMVDERPDSNLVFLIDVSGSMSPFNKLPLLKRSLKAMVGGLTERDMVTLVVYAGQSRVHLAPTPGSETSRLIASIDLLRSGGSTNGESGIQLAYELASKHRIPNGVNRVLLATDGDFNVGTTNTQQLITMAKKRAKEDQIFLTVLGFGEDNVKDDRMEQLANQVDGVYHYIDGEREGHKVLVDEMSATLVPMAKDVKVQVEFNPAKVKRYRLIGYANRLLANRDFTDDAKDAGEMGAGHTVTAFYEIVPTGHEGLGPNDAPLKYRSAADPDPVPAQPAEANDSDDLVTVRLRYKEPTSETSQAFETSLIDEGSHWNNASEDFRFAAAVAAFGMKLRQSPYCQTSFDAIRQWADGARTNDEYGWRAELVGLIRRANGL